MRTTPRVGTIAAMLPALRLLLVTLGVLLISSPAAQAASRSLTLPAEGQVAVTFASGVKSVKVKSAPTGVTVAGGVKGGKLAVALIRPRGAKGGKVVLTLKGKAKGVKTIAAALDGGKASSCAGLDKLLAKRLAGKADVKGLAGVLAAKLCGKPAPANAAAILAQLGLGAPAAPPAPPAGPAAPSSGGRVSAPGRSNSNPTPTPPAKPCANGADDDGDGQTDLEDPGCADGNDSAETGEVPVPAECIENNSGIGMGDSTTGLGAGINRCGLFTKVRIDAAPGVKSCEIFTGGAGWTCGPSGAYGVATGPAVDIADVNLTLTGPANCNRKVTIALYRPNGEVAELYGPIARCKTGGGGEPAKPACENGIDDDGDGMIDDHFAEGALDPDPGCTSTTDTSENSETPAPANCKIALGVWDEAGEIAGATAEGCGGLRGFWYHAPGKVTECGHRFGAGALLNCQIVRETGGTMFDGLSFDKLSVYTALEAAANCNPMTLALIREDHSVIYARAKLDDC